MPYWAEDEYHHPSEKTALIEEPVVEATRSIVSHPTTYHRHHYHPTSHSHYHKHRYSVTSDEEEQQMVDPLKVEEQSLKEKLQAVREQEKQRDREADYERHLQRQ